MDLPSLSVKKFPHGPTTKTWFWHVLVVCGNFFTDRNELKYIADNLSYLRNKFWNLFEIIFEKIMIWSFWWFLGGIDLKNQIFSWIYVQKNSTFTSNPNFVWGVRQKWSHDDLLTHQIPKWVVLTENDS